MFRYYPNTGYLLILIDVICFCGIIISLVINSVLIITFDCYISNIVEINSNFESKPIFNLKEGNSSCDASQEVLEIDEWPGTVIGCDCNSRKDVSFNKYNSNLYRGQCDGRTGTNCKVVDAVDSVRITKWKKKLLCHDKKNQNYSYESLLSISVKDDKECEIGFKSCGYLDNLKNKMCLPENDECPINFAVITNEKEPPSEYGNYTYKTISFDDGTNLHYTNDAVDRSVIIKLKLTEGDVCLDIDEYNSNGTRYQLDFYEHYGCNNNFSDFIYDERYEYFDTMNKYELYSDNNVFSKVSSLKQYPVEDMKNEDIMLYKRSYMGFDRECLRISKFKPEHLKNFESHINAVKNLNLTIVCFLTLNLVFFVGAEGIKYKERFNYQVQIVTFFNYPWYCITFILSTISFCMTTSIKEIGNECGDEYNVIIMNMVQDELNRMKAYLQVILFFSLFSICAYFIDDLFIFLYKYFTNKEPEQKVKIKKVTKNIHKIEMITTEHTCINKT